MIGVTSLLNLYSLLVVARHAFYLKEYKTCKFLLEFIEEQITKEADGQ